MANQHTPQLQHAIELGKHQARQHGHATYGGPHLLYGLLDEESGLSELYHALGLAPSRLRRWAEFRIKFYPKSPKVVEDPPPDQGMEQLFKEADRIRKKTVAGQVESIHALEALCMPDVVFMEDQLINFPLQHRNIAAWRQGGSAATNDSNKADSPSHSTPSSFKSGNSTDVLDRFCDDLTHAAHQGEIDPVIGRSEELKKMVIILGKRISPNILLVGEPGVGKTALVGGLALAIKEKQVPLMLQGVRILELDVHGRLVAGAYKGEVEERLKKIIVALKEGPKTILFVDEIHSLLDSSGSVGSGVINLLKPELARGKIILIGATTHAEYKKYIEKDPAFARRFTKLEVSEPNVKKAAKMISGISANFETHHQLKISQDSIPEAVRLARRYFTQKRLPASAIELLDITLSSVNVINETVLADLDSLTLELEQQEATESESLSEFWQKIAAQVGAILISRLPDQKKEEELSKDEIRKRLDQLKTLAAEKLETVDSPMIVAMASHLSGIPLGKIGGDESARLLQMPDLLRRRVIGQDHAIDIIYKRLSSKRAIERDGQKPRGVFFFAGPTGTGKTELVKALAENIFNDERAIVRFDMSEYMERQAAETFLGAPPGLVGHEKGGLLVNEVREKPYSVVLFDEIEKAHSNLYKLMLQVLDEARLTDRLGKTADFSNTIIVFTSNVCSDWIVEQFKTSPLVTREGQNILREKMKQLKDDHGISLFLPEFIGRIPDIIPFAPITKDTAGNILELKIKKIAGLLASQDLELELRPEARNFLLDYGFSPSFGARPLEYAIEDKVVAPIAELIIKGELQPGKIVIGDKVEDDIIWEVKIG